MNTSTQYSNFAFEEIFSDKLDSSPTLLSRSQTRRLSEQRRLEQKVKNEKKQTKHQR